MKTRAEAEAYVTKETDRRGNLSQRARILRLLLSVSEAPLPAILDLRVGQYGARINELRGLGFDVRNRIERIDGTVHSWYSLVTEPTWEERRRVTDLLPWDAGVDR